MSASPDVPPSRPRLLVAIVVAGMGASTLQCGLLAGLDDWKLAGNSSDAAATTDGKPSPRSDAETDRDAELDGGVTAKDATSDAIPPIDSSPPRCSPQAAFGPPSLLADLNSLGQDAFARFTPDELTVYFDTDRLSGAGKVFRATRPSIGASFTAPVPVPEFDLADVYEVAPTIAPDALSMLFQTVDGASARQIWLGGRASTSVPFTGIVALLSLPGPAQYPYALPPLAAGQVRFVYTFGPIATGPFVPHEATIPVPGAAPVIKPIPFQSIPGSGFEASVITADDTEFFGTSQGALWQALRPNASATFATPTLIPGLDDATYKEFPDYISADACRLYFHRGTTNNGSELFVATRPLP